VTVKGPISGSLPTLVNGEPVGSLPVTDRGLAYGDGVFETLRITASGPVLYTEHLQRLAASCQRLHIPLDLMQVHRHIEQLLNTRALLFSGEFDTGIIKLIVTRGDGGRGYMPPVSVQPRIIVQWHPLPSDLAQPAEQGIVCALIDQPVSLNPQLAGMKHLNRLDQVLASQVMQRLVEYRPQLREVLMPDPYGWLIEGSRSNIFAVFEGQLCTPDLSHAGVAGVMRQHLLQAAREAGKPGCIRPIGVSELTLASEVFICNSVIGVWPVHELWSGARAETPLAAWTRHPRARWAQGLFDTCLSSGRLSLPAGAEIQRPDSLS